MKLSNPFKRLSKFEWILWSVSIAVVTASFFFSPQSPLSLIASLVGVTALIFLAKGMVIGQILVILFAVLYGIVSFEQKYYGEMITYVGMSAPMALSSMISWIKNPFGNAGEVKIARLSKKKAVLLAVSAVIVTAAFYFILGALENANLIVSTLSVATSFIASMLTFLRSPYYALGYALNDIVLIVLWSVSAFNDISYLPIVMCFVMFLLNDLYGFYSWQKRRKEQSNQYSNQATRH